MKKDNQQIIIYLAGAGLLYFGILKPVLNKLGITKSAEDRVIENQTNLPNNINPFSPEFYKKAPGGSLLLKVSFADQLAERLHKAMGYFTDDEAVIFSVFRSLRTQSQVSFLSDRFQQIYKTDLLEYLKRGDNNWNPGAGLNESELNTVISIVNKLPKYKI